MATTGSLPDDSDVRDINVVGFYDDSAYYAVAYVESLEIGGRPYLARQVHSAIAGLVLSAYRLGFGVYGGDLSLPGPRLRRRNLEARRHWVDPATSSKHQPQGERERYKDSFAHRFTSSQEGACAARTGKRIAFPEKNSNTADEARAIRRRGVRTGPQHDRWG